jgi:hypothetical protein
MCQNAPDDSVLGGRLLASIGTHPVPKAGHSREKLALSLPKGENPARGSRISEGLRSGFPPFGKLRASFSRE